MGPIDNHPLISIVLCLLIVIFPVLLSDISVPAFKDAPPARSLLIESAPALRISPREKSKMIGTVDRKVFLAAFERQAGSGLIPCLNDSIGVHGSVTFLARLHRAGTVSAVRILNPTDTRADCITEAVEKMSFPAAGNSIKEHSLEIEWRFDF